VVARQLHSRDSTPGEASSEVKCRLGNLRLVHLPVHNSLLNHIGILPPWFSPRCSPRTG
jgi:hypothetical protein